MVNLIINLSKLNNFSYNISHNIYDTVLEKSFPLRISSAFIEEVLNGELHFLCSALTHCTYFNLQPLLSYFHTISLVTFIFDSSWYSTLYLYYFRAFFLMLICMLIMYVKHYMITQRCFLIVSNIFFVAIYIHLRPWLNFLDYVSSGIF